MSTPSTDEETGRISATVMRGELAVQVASGKGCGVIGSGIEADVVRHQLKCNRKGNAASTADATESLSGCGECHVELVYTQDCTCATDRQPAEYVVSAMTSNCVCPVFDAHDCLAEIEAIHDRTVSVSVTAPDRDAFRDLIDDLRTVATSVTVKRLFKGGTGVETIAVEIEELTPKRREAVETAIEMGYYKRPQDSDLGDLAERLGITRAAVSARLNAVERKLVRSINDE